MVLQTTLVQDTQTIQRLNSVPSILKVVADLTGMRFTVVARVTPESWIACAVHDAMGFGMQVGDQLDVNTTLCKEVCERKTALVIEHASRDPIYSTHPTPKQYKIESYIAIPIFRPSGEVFGTLCAIDREPAPLDAKVVTSLTLFSELISEQLRSEEERRVMEKTLWDERKISQLREQFIAVLGHDLRTPLGGIVGAVDALLEMDPKPEDLEMLRVIQESSQQMSRLIEDVLDFARGRLGEGVAITKKLFEDISPLIRQTIDVLLHSHRGRTVRFAAAGPVAAFLDEVRFRQLISNLVGNALQHSPAGEPVDVGLDVGSEFIRLAIRNGGPPLPAEIANNPFSPFQRSSKGRKNAGLGLGLYIAAQIAQAHGGSLVASSDNSGTTFTLLLPRAQ